MEMHAVLLPTNFSKDAENACQQGFALAARAHARVLLLHVLRTNFVWRDTPLPMRAHLEQEMRIEAEQRLTLLAASQGRPVDTLVLWGNPAVTICRVAEEQEVDVIVMSTHRRSGLAHLFSRSVVEQVICRAPCSVFIPAPAQTARHSSGGFQVAHGIRLPCLLRRQVMLRQFPV